MAPEPRSALPERPLRKRELTELVRAGAYSVRRYSDEAYAIVFVGSEHVYGLGVDTDPLEAFAEEVGEYYRTLADRLEEEAEEEQPADRMYM